MAEEHNERNVVSRFIHAVFRWIRNYFIFVGVVVTVMPILMVWAVRHGMHKEVEPAVVSRLSTDHPTRLNLNLVGQLTDREPDFTDIIFTRFFKSQHEIYIPELRTALRRAAKDKRIAGLDLSIGMVQGTPAEYSELRRSIADYRTNSGKTVTALISEPEDWTYYVASAASRITINPASSVTIPGPAFHLTYFGEALKKLGLDMDVVRAGKYKSAFEPFVQNKPSEPTLEEYNAMQKSMLDHMISQVAKDRGKSEDIVRGWYKRSLYTADEAVKAGMIDAIGYETEAAADAKGAKDGKDAKDAKPAKDDDDDDRLTVSEYADAIRKEKEDSASGSAGLALIEATGEINMDGQGPAGGPRGDENITPEDMHKRLAWAKDDDDVKAVVLRVSSPGGSAVASDMIWHDVKELADAKPVVVSMGGYAASGGYYISAPARYIVAEPTTITGSIGVIGMLPSAKGFEEKWGVSFHVISSSDRREMLNLGSKATPEDKTLVEATIDQVYQTFLKKVAQGRKLKVDKVAELAQGRVYTGLQAKELGLVDEIGGEQAAFNEAKRLAGLDVTKLYPVLHYEEDTFDISQCMSGPRKFLRCLKRGQSHLRLHSQQVTSLVTTDAATAESTIEAWLTRAKSERAWVYWPGYLSVQWR